MIAFLSTISAGLFALYVCTLARSYKWKCISLDLQMELDRHKIDLVVAHAKIAALSTQSLGWRKHAVECHELRIRLIDELASAKKALRKSVG